MTVPVVVSVGLRDLLLWAPAEPVFSSLWDSFQQRGDGKFLPLLVLFKD